MATPNYGFAKRQKELAKKAKQEEKRLRKAKEKEGTQPDGAADQPAPGEAADTGTPPAA